MAQHRAVLAVGMSGIALVAVGCSSSSSSPTVTVTESAPESPAASPAETPTAAPTKTPASSTSTLPPPPAGSTKLGGSSSGGNEYARYKTSKAPKKVVNTYKREAKNEGYTIKNSGGSGGGWGGWGGSDYGMTAEKSGAYLEVQAGGETSGPTYFEVCVGAEGSAALRHCDDSSNDDREDSRSKGS